MHEVAESTVASALERLSDRQEPDYRNSIKESISAVESACQLVARKPGTTLGVRIKAIKGNGFTHPALEEALGKFCGYTSDERGIRHALTADSSIPTYAEAKFMLVACSAFVNFILTRLIEVGLSIAD
jgi:hypothetical protein